MYFVWWWWQRRRWLLLSWTFPTNRQVLFDKYIERFGIGKLVANALKRAMFTLYNPSVSLWMLIKVVSSLENDESTNPHFRPFSGLFFAINKSLCPFSRHLFFMLTERCDVTCGYPQPIQLATLKSATFNWFQLKCTTRTIRFNTFQFIPLNAKKKRNFYASKNQLEYLYCGGLSNLNRARYNCRQFSEQSHSTRSSQWVWLRVRRIKLEEDGTIENKQTNK